MNTRANAAGRNAKTTQNAVATATELTPATSAPLSPTVEQTEEQPLANAAPLLLRLEAEQARRRG